MNYYGTRRRGHDLAFHSELRDALFASGLPFVLSINDVPEAWELYSRAGSITRLCSGKNSSKPERFWNAGGTFADRPAELAHCAARVRLRARSLWLMSGMCGLSLEVTDLRVEPPTHKCPL